MYKAVDDRIRKALRHHIHERYKTDVPVVTERPPKLAMGEVASPALLRAGQAPEKTAARARAGNCELAQANSTASSAWKLPAAAT